MAEPPRQSLKFSVVISTCDRASSLATLLEALRRQTYPHFEVVVVQGPCQDGTPELLDRHSEHLRVVRCAERNLSKSRNLGIDAAAGDVIAFIDDDAIPEPRWLEDLARAYDGENVGGAGGLTLDPSGTRAQYRYSICSRIGLTDFDREPPLDRFNRPHADPFLYLQGTNCSFRRTVLERVRGFDEEIEYNYDESEVCSCVLDAGWELRALEHAVVHHKFLNSFMRREAGFTDPFFPMKNRAYFALRMGRGYASNATTMTSLTKYLQDIIDWTLDCQRRGLFNEEEVESFVRRAEQGFALGIERGLAGLRKGRPIAAAHPADFLPYPRLEPDDGPRLCMCFVSIDQPPKPAAGIARFTNDLAQGFADVGHEVHMVTRDDEGDYRLDYEQGIWFHRFPVHGRWLPGLQDHPLAGLLHHLAAVHNAVEAVADRAPVDVVSGSLWIAEPLLCAFNPSWVTAVACNTPTRKIAELQPETAASEITPWQVKVEDALLTSPAHLQPVSHTNAEYVLETPGVSASSLEVIWHGVRDRSREFPRRRGADDEVQVLFVGRLEPRKGVDTLLEAMLPLVEAEPRVTLRIIGADNPHANGGEHYWEEWLREHIPPDVAARRQITFEGSVDDPVLFQAYADCDVFCAPSRYESFGLVHVEAMMFGRPVIASRAGGMQETVLDGVTGLLVEPGDAVDLERALGRLIADAPLREQLGSAGRRRYEDEFRNEIAVRRNVKFYRRLIEGRRKPSAEEASAVTQRGVASMLRSVTELPDAAAETAAVALLARRRFPVDYEYGVRTLLDIADDDAFVRGLYRLLLKREPEPGMNTVAFYGDELRTGDRMAVVRTIVASTEARARGITPDLLTSLPAVHMMPAGRPGPAPLPRRAIRARLRRGLRQARDLTLGVKATRSALAGTQAALLQAGSTVPRLVQQELTADLQRLQAELSTELTNGIDSVRHQVDERVERLNANLREELEVMARKQEGLAIDVREKLPDVITEDLPEPAIADPQGYRRKVQELGELRVNLGCGEKPLPGYLNVDMRPLPEVDIVADVRRLPFEPGSLSEIASAHLVEHFRQHHLEVVILPYWRSLLVPGGILRIVCPNWAVMIEQLNAGGLSFAEFKQVTFGLQDYSGDDHFAMYSPDTLSQLLTRAGFSHIEVLEERRQNGLSPEMELTARADGDDSAEAARPWIAALEGPR